MHHSNAAGALIKSFSTVRSVAADVSVVAVATAGVVDHAYAVDTGGNISGMGEQTVTSAIIASGMITFSTNRLVPAAAGTCATTLGEAWGYWLNLFNGSGGIGVSGSCGGTRSSIFVGGGLPPSPVLGTVPINGVPKTVVVGAVQRSGGASTPISPQEIIPAVVTKRKTVYWKSSGDN